MNTALLDITKNESVGFEEIQAPKTTEFSGKKCITLEQLIKYEREQSTDRQTHKNERNHLSNRKNP